MESVILIKDLEYVDRIRRFDKVYFGSETCEEFIPSLDLLSKVSEYTARKVTLVTSIITDKGLNRIKLLIESNIDKYVDEIIVNDLGLLRYLKKSNFSFKIIMGRLLDKIIGFQDPDFFREYDIARRVYSTSTKNDNEMSHENHDVINFDYYYPYKTMSVTRLCKFRFQNTKFEEKIKLDCSKTCKGNLLEIKNDYLDNTLLDGNAFIEYRNQDVPRINYLRLVFQPLIDNDFQKIIKINHYSKFL